MGLKRQNTATQISNPKYKYGKCKFEFCKCKYDFEKTNYRNTNIKSKITNLCFQILLFFGKIWGLNIEIFVFIIANLLFKTQI